MPSKVRLVVIMDPIETIKPAKDSTLAILAAAQAHGWQVFYAEQQDLSVRDGVAFAHLAPLQVFDDLKAWFMRGERQREVADPAKQVESQWPVPPPGGEVFVSSFVSTRSRLIRFNALLNVLAESVSR